MIDELYAETILDHSKHPRNFGSLAGANHEAEGFNPLCGDHCKVLLKESGGKIEAIRFEGGGCAISTSSASLMTEALQGKTVAEAEEWIGKFLAMLTREGTDPEELGKLAVFSGVREFPVRVKCATLAWHTLRAALRDQQEAVSTE